MIVLYYIGRLAATVLALLAGYNGWSLVVLGGAIALHAGASYFNARAQFAGLKAQIAVTASDARTAERHARFYEPMLVRELALAFVRCGIAYAFGFWLAQFLTLPTAPAPAPPPKLP